MPTVRGKYSSNSLGKDKVTEMDRERTRPKTLADGKSFADLVDRNSTEESNFGYTASIKRGGGK
jgi:hypothetical protein